MCVATSGLSTGAHVNSHIADRELEGEQLPLAVQNRSPSVTFENKIIDMSHEYI
jgi:hypothetical protein